MRVYISGPIAGQPNRNRAVFAEAAKWLRVIGRVVPLNPHDVTAEHPGLPCFGRPTGRPDDPHRYGCYLLADLAAMRDCDAIIFLPGWETSSGARVEAEFAKAIGLTDLGEFKRGEHGPSCGRAYEDGFNEGEELGIDRMKHYVEKLLTRVRATPADSPGAVREIEAELKKLIQ